MEHFKIGDRNLNTQDSQDFQPVIFQEANELVDAINDIIDGTTSLEEATVTGVANLTGGIVAGKGNITQITAITTGVATGAKPAGVITTVSSTLAAGSNATFIVTNGLVTSSSVIMLTVDDSATAGLAKLNVQTVSTGVFSVNITNIHATNAFNNVIKIHYLIV